MLDLPALEHGKRGSRRQPVGISRPDSRNERRDQPVRHLPAEAAREECPHALPGLRAAPNEGLGKKPQFAQRRQQARQKKRLRARGESVELSVELDESRQPGIGEKSGPREAELLHEPPDLGRRPHGVGAELEEVAVRLLGPDDAPGAPRGFEDVDLFAAAREDVRPDEAREPPSDDDRRA